MSKIISAYSESFHLFNHLSMFLKERKWFLYKDL